MPWSVNYFFKPMIGIKRYSHEEREKVLNETVPLIKQKFGRDLLSIAARGSFARKTDGPYSDLELFAFLKKMPKGQEELPYAKMHKIRNGLSIELIWITEKVYVDEVKEVSSSWFGVGSEKLLFVFNKKFATRLRTYKVKNLKKKCLDQAAALWPRILCTSSIVQSIVSKKEHERTALALYQMLDVMLNFLSFVNRRPFTTSSKKIFESQKFKIQPCDFSKLTKLIVNGNFKNYSTINKLVLSVVRDLKKYLEVAGYSPRDVVEKTKRSDIFGMTDGAKRYEQAVATWEKVQESTTKTLNAAELKNFYGIATVINDMFFQYLKILSCLNAKTLRFSRIIADAKKLKYKPQGFTQLIDSVENGKYKNFALIKEVVHDSFSELENMLLEKGYMLYQDNIDPN